MVIAKLQAMSDDGFTTVADELTADFEQAKACSYPEETKKWRNAKYLYTLCKARPIWQCLFVDKVNFCTYNIVVQIILIVLIIHV